MYIQGTYIKCTYSYVYAQILEGKKLPTLGIEPRISDILSSGHNHFASSFDIKSLIVIVYIYSSTWRLVTYVLRRTSSPPRPHHDVAWPSLDIPVYLSLFKAKTGDEAGLGGADVAAHSSPIEEKPAT